MREFSFLRNDRGAGKRRIWVADASPKNEVLARQDGFRAIVRSSGTEQSEGGSTLFLHVFRQRTECFPVHFSFRKQMGMSENGVYPQ